MAEKGRFLDPPGTRMSSFSFVSSSTDNCRAFCAFIGLGVGTVLTGDFEPALPILGVSWTFGVKSPSTGLGVFVGEVNDDWGSVA